MAMLASMTNCSIEKQSKKSAGAPWDKPSLWQAVCPVIKKIVVCSKRT
jgi:hypothetical protein